MGFLTHRFATEHGGLGGWRANAAAHLMIQIPGVAPGALRVRSEPYRAVAVAPDPELGDEPFEGGAPSLAGFYMGWNGIFRDVPYPPPRTAAQAQAQVENKQACEVAREYFQQMHAEMAANGSMVPTAPMPVSCQNQGLAFQGDYAVLTGALEGEVIVESITGGVVTGTFDLRGDGTLTTITSQFIYDEGRLSGDDSEEALNDGPIRMRGTFRAPAHLEGAPIGLWGRTVRLDNAGPLR